MEEKVIGLVYRFGKNDYQISLMDFDKHDQSTLMAMMEKYDDKCSCERGDKTLTLDNANVDYWEKELEHKNFEKQIKKLAHELYDLCMVETGVWYDGERETEENQITEKHVCENLHHVKATAYMLETILDCLECGSDDAYFPKFYEASKKLIRHLETLGWNMEETK